MLEAWLCFVSTFVELTQSVRNLSFKLSKGKNIKGKVLPRAGHERPGGDYRYCFTLTLTTALDVGEWSKPRPSRFTPRKEPVRVV